MAHAQRERQPPFSREICLLSPRNERGLRGLIDNSILSRHGKSSGELGSVMILNPTIGNSWKQGASTENITMNNKLFVGNLSFNTTENDLQDTFASARHRPGNQPDDGPHQRPSSWFWFCHHEHPEEAQKAIDALNGSKLGWSCLDRQCRQASRRSRGWRRRRSRFWSQVVLKSSFSVAREAGSAMPRALLLRG